MKMDKIFIIFITVFFSYVAPDCREQPSIEQIIYNAFSSPQVCYEGTKTMINWSGKSTQATELKIFYCPPNKFRYEFKAPALAAKRIIINDGNFEWQYEPKHKVVIKQEYQKEPIENINNGVNMLLKNYNVELSSQEENIIGRESYIITVKSKPDNKILRKLWIDKKTNIILQNKWFKNGKIISISQFSKIDFPKKLPDNLFQFFHDKNIKVIKHNTPKTYFDIKELKKDVKFDILEPKNIPNNYTFKNGNILYYRNKQIVHLHYTDGLNLISLYESLSGFDFTPSANNLEKRFSNESLNKGLTSNELIEGYNIIRSKCKNINYVLIGNLDKKSLMKIDFYKERR